MAGMCVAGMCVAKVCVWQRYVYSVDALPKCYGVHSFALSFCMILHAYTYMN